MYRSAAFVLLGSALAAPFFGSWTAAGASPAIPSVVPPSAPWIGAAACGACHETNHAKWSGSRHSRMVQEAEPRTVLGDFRGEIRLHDRTFGLKRKGDRFFVVESFLQEKPTERPVDYTLGSRRIQHYLTTLDDGRIVVLPPTWDVASKRFIHNMDIVDVEETAGTAVQVWNTHCFGCHVSGESKNFSALTQRYATTWTDFGTACERCHGPGRAHAEKYERAAAGENVAPPKLIVRATRLDPERSVSVCAQCHSLRDQTIEGFTAGSDYFDHFLPVLEYAQKPGSDPAYFADGRPRRFANDALGLWQSECAARGGATCITCHDDPHEPDPVKNAAILTSGASCAKCHPTVVALGATHTRHVQGTAGSRCVDCHMPRTVVSLGATMPDHTLSVPAPRNTRRFGIPNACTGCHPARSAEWAEAEIAKRWATDRRRRYEERAALFDAARRRDAGATTGLVRLSSSRAEPVLVRANAVGYLRRRALDPAAFEALRQSLADPHPLLRAIAALGLGDGPADGKGAREALVATLQDRNRIVRMNAAISLVALGWRPDPRAPSAGFDGGKADYLARARFLEDNPSAQADRGQLHGLLGEYDESAAALENALRLDPGTPGAVYQLALARLGQGRANEARTLLVTVPKADPHAKAARNLLARIDASRKP